LPVVVAQAHTIVQAVVDLEVLVVAEEEELITGLHRCRVTFQDY
jgi:hypothetical protein